MNRNDDQDCTTEINFSEMMGLRSWINHPVGTLAVTPEPVLEWLPGGPGKFSRARLRITIKKVTE